MVRHAARRLDRLAESYIAGWWDTDDLTAVVRARVPPNDRRSGSSWTRRRDGPAGCWRGCSGSGRRASTAIAQNIAAHYDLSNDFFALMLDPTMAYSCAYFADDETSLEAAQMAKFEMIAGKLQLGPEDHVIEIGSGWGGFALHAAEQHGCRVTTTTISEAQRSMVEKRVAQRGLADRVTVLGADYRELEGRYDALVSIEMIEAVDWRRHDEFFAVVRPAPRPTEAGWRCKPSPSPTPATSGRSCTTTSYEPWCSQAAACPRSAPSPVQWLAHRTCELSTCRTSARTTPRHSGAGGPTSRAGASAVERLGFDERFWRFWTLYLCYCEAAFMERHVSDVQLVLARPGAPTQRLGSPHVTPDPRPGSPHGAVQVVDHLAEAACVASAPARSQTSRMLLAGDSSSADENGQAGAHVVNGSHDRPHRTIVVSHGHRDGHRQWSLRLGNCAAEGRHRDIGTEVDDFEAAAAQDVRSHGGREPVQLVGRSPQDHAAALRTPAP